MKKYVLAFVLLTFALVFAACNAGADNAATSGKVIKTHAADNLKITLLTDDGVIKNGKEEFTIVFETASGEPAKIDAASVNFHMPAMGTMAVMNDPATLTSTSTPGVFKGTVDLEMAGEWQVQITYEGAAVSGKTSFPITAQ